MAIQDISHLNSKSKLPMGILRLIRDSFLCRICLGIPIQPPVILSKRCKSITIVRGVSINGTVVLKLLQRRALLVVLSGATLRL